MWFVKTRFSALTCYLVVTLVALGAVSAARADVASDKPGAILVFPKLLVHTEGDTGRLDTFVRISNISTSPINVLCYYVNTTPRCPVEGSCFPDRSECPEICDEVWQPTDFVLRLTRDQPTGWLVSDGQGVGCRRLRGLCSNDDSMSCVRDNECGSGNRCVLPPCLPLTPDERIGPGGQTNENSLIPLSPEDPFIGELKCIAVDETLAPVDRNVLVGRALIGYLDEAAEFIDVAGYNPIAIPAIAGANNRNRTLVIGGPTGSDPGGNPADRECRDAVPSTCAEYEGCPNILILDHFAEGAIDPLALNRCEAGTCTITGADCTLDGDCFNNICQGGKCTVTQNLCPGGDDDCVNECVAEVCTLSQERCGPFDPAGCSEPTFNVRVTTHITLVPCTEDFESTTLTDVTAQYLVFNEFEQRFSTSKKVTCFQEIPLSLIDTVSQENSVFTARVLGTMTGQTRIRGVDNGASGRGYALVAIAEEFRCGGPEWQFPLCNFVNPADLVSSTGKNFHFQGRRPRSDFVYLP
jgi:hypothetical protein